MSSYDNASIVRSVYDAFNKREFDPCLNLFSPDVEWVNVATGQVLRGQEGMRQFFQGWSTAFPDARVEVVNMIATGEWVVTEFRGQGTHRGPLATPGGSIRPTQRPIDVAFCEVIQIHNGQIIRGRSYFDLATFMGQLGLMPSEMAGERPMEHGEQPWVWD